MTGNQPRSINILWITDDLLKIFYKPLIHIAEYYCIFFYSASFYWIWAVFYLFLIEYLLVIFLYNAFYRRACRFQLFFDDFSAIRSGFYSFYYILCINAYLRTKTTNKADKRAWNLVQSIFFNILFRFNARFFGCLIGFSRLFSRFLVSFLTVFVLAYCIFKHKNIALQLLNIYMFHGNFSPEKNRTRKKPII